MAPAAVRLSLLLGGFIGGSAAKKHILALLIDDYGWADAGWHARTEPERGFPDPRREVQTPHLDGLVAAGIELERHYVFAVCSPTRSAIQTGRNPLHVNTVNDDPLNYNPRNNVSGFAAIPRNMTGLAELLRDKGGMATRFYGKWDCGMATMEHTPRGRGYDRSLSYFHHMVNYWTSTFENPNGNTNFFPECKKFVGDPKGYRPVDFWVTNGSGYEGPWTGPERGAANSAKCNPSDVDLCGYNDNATCPPYPGWPDDQVDGCVFEDDIFKDQLLADLHDYDGLGSDSGLFIFWAPHVVHTPLQPPQTSLSRFAHVVDWRRRRYLALVHYIDSAVGEVVETMKAKGMWEDTLVVMSSDNGGPIYASGGAGANNFPLKGGKASNWEGGIRVNAFVSGGLLPSSRRGIRLTGLSTGWDWYATLADIMGVTDISDAKAAAAGLPEVDSVSLWPYWNGTTKRSPRTTIAIGQMTATNSPKAQSQVQGFIADMRDDNGSYGLWKLLLGHVSMAGWQSESFPNHTTGSFPVHDCGHVGCLYELESDPTEHRDFASARPAVVAKLRAAIDAEQAAVFSPDRGRQDPQSCVTAMEKWAGFWGPWVNPM